MPIQEIQVIPAVPSYLELIQKSKLEDKILTNNYIISLRIFQYDYKALYQLEISLGFIPSSYLLQGLNKAIEIRAKQLNLSKFKNINVDHRLKNEISNLDNRKTKRTRQFIKPTKTSGSEQVVVPSVKQLIDSCQLPELDQYKYINQMHFQHYDRESLDLVRVRFEQIPASAFRQKLQLISEAVEQQLQKKELRNATRKPIKKQSSGSKYSDSQFGNLMSSLSEIKLPQISFSRLKEIFSWKSSFKVNKATTDSKEQLHAPLKCEQSFQTQSSLVKKDL